MYFQSISENSLKSFAVGFALGNEIDLKRCIIYTGGRVPLEIAKKQSPAKESGLSFIASAGRDGLRINCGKESHCEKNGECI